MKSSSADWDYRSRAQSSGLISLVVATVVSFGAGIGSTLLYLQANKDEVQVVVPLIEAERGPTRVRPDGLDANGEPVLRAGLGFSATSSAQAMTLRSETVPVTAPPPNEAVLSLPVQGIPAAIDATVPSDARVVAEVTPEKEVPVIMQAAASRRGEPQYRLQLASFRTAEAANHEMARVGRAYGAQLGSSSLSVERIDTSRGVLFRVLSAPIVERETAGRTCAALAEKRAQCMVIATSVRAPAPKPATIVASSGAASQTVVKSDNAKQIQKTDAPSSEVRVQLGSLRSPEGANREVTRLSRLYAGQLAATDLSVSRIDQGDRGVFYRILTAPLPSRAAATDLCSRLGGGQAGCILIQPRPNDA